MSWSKFDGKAYTQEEFAAHVAGLRWTDWKPEGITLHNTAAPTLKQWAESGPAHDARIRNLQSFYENEKGWHAGPHLFVSRTVINGFSNLLLPGVHSRCWNATRFGIEMVGDYAVEEFNSGDGALVRDNAVFAMAILNKKFKFDPEDLVFHKECDRDNHDCPGRKVVKGEVIERVKAKMLEIGPSFFVDGVSVAHIRPPEPAGRAIAFQASGRMSTFGGPHDGGMRDIEGLAIFETIEEATRCGVADFFMSEREAGVPGLGRRLRVERFYVACRWDYTKTTRRFLQNAVVWAEAKGKKVAARPMDWGPNVRTGRAADFSPGLARELGLSTDDLCTVTVYADGK